MPMANHTKALLHWFFTIHEAFMEEKSGHLFVSLKCFA